MIGKIRASLSGIFTKAPDPLAAEIEAMAEGLAYGSNPPRRGVHETLRAYGELPQLQRVFGRIASSVAGVPFVTYRVRDARGKAIRYRSLEHAGYQARKAMLKRLADAERLETIDGDPLVDFLEAGNTYMSGFECREVMQLHLDLVGECFARKERNALGMPVRYWPLPPTWIRDVPSISGEYFEVEVGAQKERVPREDVIWIKYPNPLKPYGRGAGLGISLGDELATDEYAAGYMRTFFFNNATPSSVVAIPDATPAQLKRLEAQWDQRNRGTDRAHRTHFLNAEATITALKADLGTMSLVDLRRYLSDVVRETPGVPPEIVGQIDNSNRATIEAATYIFARWVEVPRLDRWRDALQAQVVPDFDRANKGPKRQRILDYESPVPEDRDFLLEVAKIAPWSRTRAEWRLLQGLDSTEVDEVYLQDPKFTERPATDPAWVPPVVAPAAPVAAAAPVAVTKAATKAPVDPTIASTLATSADPLMLNESVDGFWSEELRLWGDGTLADLGVGVSFNMLNPRIVDHLQKFSGDRIVRINEGTRDAIRAQVLEAVKAGEDYLQLRDRIRDVFADASKRRATVIARTEPAISANFATYEAHRQSGIVKRRAWVATFDGRARPDHEAMDGVEVAIDQAFTFPDGVTTYAPAQSGVAHQDIQCRCTTRAVIKDEEEGEGETRAVSAADAWKAFDSALTGWEERAEAAFSRAFEAQESAVLAALDAIGGL